MNVALACSRSCAGGRVSLGPGVAAGVREGEGDAPSSTAETRAASSPQPASKPVTIAPTMPPTATTVTARNLGTSTTSPDATSAPLIVTLRVPGRPLWEARDDDACPGLRRQAAADGPGRPGYPG